MSQFYLPNAKARIEFSTQLFQVQPLFSDLTFIGDMRLIELAAIMRPAGCFSNALSDVHENNRTK